MQPTEARILEELRRKGSRILPFKDLARALDVRSDAEEQALGMQLDLLERRGDVAKVRGEKYSAIEFTNMVAGRLTARPEGFGFVLVEGGEDLYVPRAGMHGAMDGDTVMAREERTKTRGRDAGKISGTVVRCLLYTSPSPRDLSTSRMPSSA